MRTIEKVMDEKTRQTDVASVRPTLRYVAAALAFASQVFHLWSLQEQFLFRPLMGGLMFLVAILQGVLVAGLLFGPGRWMVRHGVALNLSLALVWIATRFTGSPGLLGFEQLPVEPLNVAAVIAEVGVVVLLLMVHRSIADGRIKERR